MLLGLRLELRPTSSAHNFWLGMIPEIEKHVEKLLIVSIGGRPPENDSPMPLERLLPFPLQLIYAGNPRGNAKLESSYLLKTILFSGVYPKILELVKKHQIDLIHLIDNYGPIQIAAAQFTAAKSTYQLNYNPRSPLYDEFLRLSLKSFDLVIAGSTALARKLRALQVAPRVEPIPWAVSLESLEKQTVDYAKVRAGLGLVQGAPVVLWTGFLPHIGKREFLFSLRVAKELVKELPKAQFVFAFKSEHFDERYRSFEEDRIRIISLRSRTEFLQLAGASNLLFSPCLNHRGVLGPPLTWLESMAIGLPIVTTNLPGADELIINGTNGIIIPSPDLAQQALSELLRNPEDIEGLAIEAKETVRRKFTIKNAAPKYLRAWSSITG